MTARDPAVGDVDLRGQQPPPGAADPAARLRQPHGHGPLGWWGGVMAVVCLAMALLTALFAFVYTGLTMDWPPAAAAAPPPLGRALSVAVVLLGAGATAALLDRAARRGAGLALQGWALVTVGLGAVALAVGLPAHADSGVGPTEHAYGSAFSLVLGLHQAFLAAGVVGLGVVVAQVWRRPTARTRAGAAGLAAYWYFVALSWPVAAAVVYGVPRWWIP